ncbi:MAG: hypothetical protein ACTS73_09005 [Arsenophonus sp. NEOnobi-MAG3]
MPQLKNAKKWRNIINVGKRTACAIGRECGRFQISGVGECLQVFSVFYQCFGYTTGNYKHPTA